MLLQKEAKQSIVENKAIKNIYAKEINQKGTDMININNKFLTRSLKDFIGKLAAKRACYIFTDLPNTNK